MGGGGKPVESSGRLHPNHPTRDPTQMPDDNHWGQPPSPPEGPKPSLIQRIPGFRSGTPWKRWIAIVGYSFAALTVIGAMSDAFSPHYHRTSEPVAGATQTPAARPRVEATQHAFVTPPPATPRPTVALTPAPTKAPTPVPTPVVVQTPATAPIDQACGAPSNPFGYNFFGPGNTIASPPKAFCSYFNCIPSFWKSTHGYVEECQDDMFSHSGGVQGSCSYHGGNKEPLLSH